MDWQDDFFGITIGCCLTCNEDWKYEHLTNQDENDFFTCLCRECKCRQCFWYQPIDEYNFSEGGKCTHSCKQKFFSRILYSNLKIRNVVNITDKSYLCQIGLSNLIFVPKSVVNNDGFVEKWFIERNLPKNCRIDLEEVF